jgi:hypothetical protein
MLITPVGILITTALLAVYAVYSLWMAIVWHSALNGIAGVLAIVACVGAAMLKPWSRYIVYLVAASAIATWAYSLYAAAQAGYFRLFSAPQIARSLAPGAFLVILSCYCTWAVFRQFRARKPPAPVESQAHVDEGPGPVK